MKLSHFTLTVSVFKKDIWVKTQHPKLTSNLRFQSYLITSCLVSLPCLSMAMSFLALCCSESYDFERKPPDNNDDLNSILTNRGKNAQQYVIDTNSRSPNVGQRCFRAYPILVVFLLFIISLPSLLAARKKEKLSCADHLQVSQESTQQMIAHNGRKKNVCDGDKRGGISWSSSISGYLRALSTYRNLTVCALVR